MHGKLKISMLAGISLLFFSLLFFGTRKFGMITAPEITTEVLRVPKVQEVTKGTTISVGGNLTILSTNPTQIIRGKELTLDEYTQLKSIEIGIIKNREIQYPTFEEAEIWKELVQQKAQECKGFNLKNASGSIIDILNVALQNPCGNN